MITQKIREFYQFFGQTACKIRAFLPYFLCIYFRAKKSLASPKLTELLRLPAPGNTYLLTDTLSHSHIILAFLYTRVNRRAVAYAYQPTNHRLQFHHRHRPSHSTGRSV